MRILIVGLPRSGTTWFGNTLAAAPGVHYVHEPDNRALSPFAYVGTLGLGAFPSLRPGESAPNYELLWDLAFAGGWPETVGGRLAKRVGMTPRVPLALRTAVVKAEARLARRRSPPGEHQVVKSVFTYLSVEWIAARYRPRIVLIWRSPLNKLPSFLAKGWGDGLVKEAVTERLLATSAWPPPADGSIEKATWTICAHLTMLLDAAARNPDWLTIRHETMTLDPVARYRDVFDRLGIRWSDDVEASLRASDTPGSGYDAKRIAADEYFAWKTRLTQPQVRAAAHEMERFAELPGIGSTFGACLAEI